MQIRLIYECDDPKQRGEVVITETELDQFRMNLEFEPPVNDTTPNPYGVLGKFIDIMTVFRHPQLPKKD
jgi:hypothetical protein